MKRKIITMGLGLMADAEKPIQSYSHSIDKDNKIR